MGSDLPRPLSGMLPKTSPSLLLESGGRCWVGVRDRAEGHITVGCIPRKTECRSESHEQGPALNLESHELDKGASGGGTDHGVPLDPTLSCGPEGGKDLREVAQEASPDGGKVGTGRQGWNGDGVKGNVFDELEEGDLRDQPARPQVELK